MAIRFVVLQRVESVEVEHKAASCARSAWTTMVPLKVGPTAMVSIQKQDLAAMAKSQQGSRPRQRSVQDDPGTHYEPDRQQDC